MIVTARGPGGSSGPLLYPEALALYGAGREAETMRRKIRTMITSGTVTTTAAAACAP